LKTVEAAVIGVGWVGGTRADTLARTALVDKLHLCEIRPDRLAEVKALYKPATATPSYQDIIDNPNISVVYISTTPESNHYPICRDCLKSGKNVMLEKPIALELWEADELIHLAKRNNLKFTIGYSQRFNPKIAYAKKKITDGTLGNVVSVLVSRHLSRSLGKKIASRVRLSPVVMESTHDLDFVMWLLEPAKPVRVYSQGAYGYMKPVNGSHDVMFTTITMDNGVAVMIGGGWNLPPSYPNYCATWIEITGTEGSLFLDDTQRDNWLNTMKDGQTFPMSTMPGEWVNDVFAGGMGPETIHFLEACIRDTPVMVTPESARRDIEIIKKEMPLDVLEFFFLTPLPGSEDHKVLSRKGVPLDPDLNKYDLEHALTPHPNMSKAEWEKLYRDAWAIYYTPSHIETILRRAQVYGINIWRLAQIILWFAQSLTIEKVHPLQGGFVRLKNRHERRPELPVEPVWKFYPQLTWEVIVKHARVAAAAGRIFRIYRRVAAGARIAYNDQAMTPVTEDETEMLELFTHNKSAREAVDHARRIKILTAVGASAAQSTV